MFEMGAKLSEDNLNLQGSKANKKDNTSTKTKPRQNQRLKKQAKDEEFDNKILAKKEHILHINLEKRRGKTLSLLGKFYLLEQEKKELLKMLKKTLACGGSIQNNYIELQGDFRAKLKELLKKDNWKFKS